MIVKLPDISRRIAAEKGIPKVQTQKILRLAFDIIADEISGGNEVLISKFGKFIPKKTAPRIAHNIEHELIEVPEGIKPTFQPSKKFKNRGYAKYDENPDS